MKDNRVWSSLYMYVVSLAVVGSPLGAAVYRIDSQADFDVYKEAEFRPGDTIVVPLEVDRIRPLSLWTSVTQILYQAAIALAAVDSFGSP